MSQRFPQSNTSPEITPRIGRGLFATASFDTGDDVLHIDSPFLAVLETDRLDDTCAGCFGTRYFEKVGDVKLRSCSACQVPKYCDKTCQIKDWNLGHRLECAIFKALKPRILPINARAVLRVLLRMSAPPKFAYSPEELGLFHQLESHIDQIRDQNAPAWERITLSSMAVKHYSGTNIELEKILEFSAKLDVNSFNLTTAVYDRIGVYMHPYAAIMNHDCDYNSVVGFDGSEMYVKAIRPIKQGEQIFISYVDTTNRFPVRNKELLERYYFTCRCKKCLDDEKHPLSVPDVVADAFALLDSKSASYECDQLRGTITNLTDISWSLLEQPLVAIVDEYIATLISENEIESAISAAALRYLHIDPGLYPEAHSLRVVHAWVLAKLAIHASTLSPLLVLKVLGGATDGVVYQEDVSVNAMFIAWSVLKKLVTGEGESCVVPGLKETIRRAYTHVHEELRKQGTNLWEMNDTIDVEWAKIDRAATSIVGERAIKTVKSPLLL
ncbi:SET and MYND domain protein [Aspergillus granulosus]|uniref:SET and MYND domain protein n=1 Tax=Aspergillus granulosus TaxID=176169 RepID=A0ABR4HIR3_9EURO